VKGKRDTSSMSSLMQFLIVRKKIWKIITDPGSVYIHTRRYILCIQRPKYTQSALLVFYFRQWSYQDRRKDNHSCL